MDALAEAVGEWVRAGEIVGAEVLLLKDRRVVFHEALGWSDLDKRTPLQRNSVYRIRSMTKPFTATAALMLIQEGELSLEDSVAKFLPAWRNERSGGITIRQLLSHSTGFSLDPSSNPYEDYATLSGWVDALGEEGPQHPPGSRYEYSSVGGATMGAIVREITGMPLERFIETRILEAIGLGDTHTSLPPGADWAARTNPTYSFLGEDEGWAQFWDPSMGEAAPWFPGSSGLYSTVFDYARWLELWMNMGVLGNTRLVSRANVLIALRPAAARHYGLHWQLFSPLPAGGPLPAFGHAGSDGTLAVAFPELNGMALFFSQSRGNTVAEPFLELARTALGGR
jgi:CubicO group peptidase (beta-lactamase class C family)